MMYEHGPSKFLQNTESLSKETAYIKFSRKGREGLLGISDIHTRGNNIPKEL